MGSACSLLAMWNSYTHQAITSTLTTPSLSTQEWNLMAISRLMSSLDHPAMNIGNSTSKHFFPCVSFPMVVDHMVYVLEFSVLHRSVLAVPGDSIPLIPQTWPRDAGECQSLCLHYVGSQWISLSCLVWVTHSCNLSTRVGICLLFTLVSKWAAQISARQLACLIVPALLPFITISLFWVNYVSSSTLMSTLFRQLFLAHQHIILLSLRPKQVISQLPASIILS